MKKEQKMYVIKKYIMASSASDALRKERHTPADDCWVDEKYRESGKDNLTSAIGYSFQGEPE